MRFRVRRREKYVYYRFFLRDTDAAHVYSDVAKSVSHHRPVAYLHDMTRPSAPTQTDLGEPLKLELEFIARISRLGAAQKNYDAYVRTSGCTSLYCDDACGLCHFAEKFLIGMLRLFGLVWQHFQEVQGWCEQIRDSLL